MKQRVSKYNVFIHKGKSVIVYNTLWHSYLILSSTNAEALGLGSVNMEAYSSAEVYTALVANKMIIEDDLDEFAIVRDTFMKTQGDTSTFSLIINPTMACNFNCWYCYESRKNVSTMDEVDLQKVLAFVRQVLHRPGLETFHLSFFGGEPMLMYDKIIQPLLTKVADEVGQTSVKLSAGMTTNGYLLSENRLAFMHAHGINHLQITLDGNKERHNKVRFSTSDACTYEKIVGNILLALKAQIDVAVRLNVSEDTCLDVDKLLSDFSNCTAEDREYLNFHIQKVWQSSEDVQTEVDRIIQAIRERGYSCSGYYTAPGSIWNMCYADKTNQLIINPKGEIFKCTACGFSPKEVEGILDINGNIQWQALHDKRMQASPLNVEACKECNILPICIGGCSQRLLDKAGSASCPLNRSIEDKVAHAYEILSEKLEEN